MKIFKLMSHARTKRYVDKLQDIVEGLNDRPVPAIGMTPASVNVRNEIQVFHRRYDHIFRHQDATPTFQVGDYCRLRLQKTGAFDKSYTENFDNQIYRIRAIRKAPPVLVYELEDLNGIHIKGRWYRQSLSHVYDKQQI